MKGDRSVFARIVATSILAPLALLMGLAGAGCVLPIGPEFAEEKNEPPFAVNVSPPEGSAVITMSPRFEVTIQDPNPIDTLYARWFVDYPPYNQEISRMIRVNALPASSPDAPNLQTIRFSPACPGEGGGEAISPTLTHHRLLLVVADRAFIDGTIDQLPSDAFSFKVSWSFDKACK